jgi:hypothetical protein
MTKRRFKLFPTNNQLHPMTTTPTMKTTTDKHTPGPWSLEIHTANARNFFKVESEKRVICDAFRQTPEDQANARLIAAAPDLLKEMQATEASLTAILLSRVLDSTQSTFYELRRNRDALRAAIARAS